RPQRTTACAPKRCQRLPSCESSAERAERSSEIGSRRRPSPVARSRESRPGSWSQDISARTLFAHRLASLAPAGTRWRAGGSGSRMLFDWKGETVDQTTLSSNTPGDSNTLWAWLREVRALRQAGGLYLRTLTFS